MIDQFQELLLHLGQKLGIPLQPDKKGNCKLNIQNTLHIQLEYDPSQHRVLMASFICDVPAGKLRENIFRDTLKANHASPEEGTFAYSERNNKLTLFIYFPMPGLSADRLLVHLTAFIDKATQWKEGVEKGLTSHLVLSTQKLEANPFGLKP